MHSLFYNVFKNTLQYADILFIAWLVKLHVETVHFNMGDMLIF